MHREKSQKELPAHAEGDVSAACANVDDLERDMGFRPNTSIETGIHNFVTWYRGFYNF